MFAALALGLVVLDLFLYMAIAISESDSRLSVPSSVVRTVDESLAADAEGAYALAAPGGEALSEAGAWAALFDGAGAVVWEQGMPDELSRELALTDVALFAHYGYLGDYPAFIWARDDGLLVVGFPPGSYSMRATTGTPEGMGWRAFSAVSLIILVDLAILFGAYMLSKRRTMKSVGPIADALEKLAKGEEVALSTGGDLSDVAARINDASAVIRNKDRARESWIRGVSHDVRTPLAMITGYADQIVTDPASTEPTRRAASIIRAQGMRISDLVLDLNAAVRLEYDMQPLDVAEVPIPGLLREVAAEYLNGGAAEGFELSVEVEPWAQDLVLEGDRRLLKRAVQNLVQNSMNHNPNGCPIALRLVIRRDASREFPAIVVADAGRGMAPAELAQLQGRLMRASFASGPAVRESDEARESDAALSDPSSHGLGLVLVEKIVRAHGGIMQIASEEGRGFSATLSLPMRHKAP